MLETILDALLDSLKILPILFLAYVLIEIVELKTSKTIEHSKLLKGKYSPLVGASAGLIPQCGFSVIATDLYSKRKISVGTLLALYIATSDEAVPILLSYPDQYKNLFIILAVKFVLALVVGYGAQFVLKYVYKPKPEFVGYLKTNNTKSYSINSQQSKVEHNYFVGDVVLEQPDTDMHHKGCCGHHIEKEDDKHSVWDFIYHPILHSLKVFGFILIVNIVFGIIIYFVGANNIANTLNAVKWIQPFIAGLVGLIPNCASSVIITNLFAMGGLSLGACISGLIANAGIGLAVLVKQNPNRKHTISIILTLYLISVITGLIITLF